MKDDWQAGRKKRKRSGVNYCWITITHLLMNFNELTVLTGFDLMIRKDSCLPNDLHKYIHDVRWSIIRSHHQQMDLLVVKPFEVCSNLVVFNETRKMLGFYFDRKLEQEQELVFFMVNWGHLQLLSWQQRRYFWREVTCSHVWGFRESSHVVGNHTRGF